MKKNYKEFTAYATAVISFCIGWGLTIAGFIMGGGDVKDSVLWILGQSLVYCASVLGVTLYFRSEITTMRSKTKNYIDKKIAGETIDNDENFD